jgi:hypothetical protein
MRRRWLNMNKGTGVRIFSRIGRELVRFLEKARQGDDHVTLCDVTALQRSLEPGDVLLVEGNSRISSIMESFRRKGRRGTNSIASDI